MAIFLYSDIWQSYVVISLQQQCATVTKLLQTSVVIVRSFYCSLIVYTTWSDCLLDCRIEGIVSRPYSFYFTWHHERVSFRSIHSSLVGPKRPSCSAFVTLSVVAVVVALDKTLHRNGIILETTLRVYNLLVTSTLYIQKRTPSL